jgi:hypothetical protein
MALRLVYLNVMKGTSPVATSELSHREATMRRPAAMLHAGSDLSRHRLDVHVMTDAGQPVLITASPPDADGLRGLARQVAGLGQPIQAAIESMNGARFVHDQLELAGWEVQIADAHKVKGWPRWPARPTGSTPGCWPSSAAGS